MSKYRGPDAPLDESRAREAGGRRLRIGALAFSGALLGLSLATALPFRDVFGIALFYVLLPALGWAQLPLLSVTAIERTAVYAGSAATLILVGGVALVLGLVPDEAGATRFASLSDVSLAALVLWTSGLVAVGLGVIVAFQALDRRVPSGGAALVLELLPRTGREKRAFVVLSLVAGVSEEVAYRGYAFAAVGSLVEGAWPAAVASTVPFALLHAYQGPVGILRTGLVGFAFAVSVVVTGSLLPAILAHAAIDVLAGLVVGPWLLASTKREG